MAQIVWNQAWNGTNGVAAVPRPYAGAADVRITQTGRHLYRGARRIRLIGDHLCNGCAAPNVAGVAAGMAARHAAYGFTCNRWHNFDSSSSANESCFNGTFTAYDTTFLVNFDANWATQKAAGIYAWLNFAQPRRVGTFAGLPPGGSGTDPYWGLYWHPLVYDAMSAHMDVFLERTNTVTGLVYKNDPALAVVEPTNEDGIHATFDAGRFDILVTAARQPFLDDFSTKLATSFAAQGVAFPLGRLPTKAEYNNTGIYSAAQKTALRFAFNAIDLEYATARRAWIKAKNNDILVVIGEHNYSAPQWSYAGDGVSRHWYMRTQGGNTGGLPFTASNLGEFDGASGTNGGNWSYAAPCAHPDKFYVDSENGINGLNKEDFTYVLDNAVVQSLQDHDGYQWFLWSNNRFVSGSAGIVGDLRVDQWGSINLSRLHANLLLHGNDGAGYIDPLPTELVATISPDQAASKQATQASGDVSAFRFLSVGDGSEWAPFYVRTRSQIGTPHSIPAASSYNAIKDSNVAAGYQATAQVYIRNAYRRVTAAKANWIYGSGVVNQTAGPVTISGVASATSMCALLTSLDNTNIGEGKALLTVCRYTAPTDAAGFSESVPAGPVTSYGTAAATRLNTPNAITYAFTPPSGLRQRVYRLTPDGAVSTEVASTWSGGVVTFTTDPTVPWYLMEADGSVTPPTLSIGDVTVGESAGNAVFTVSMSSPSTSVVTVSYATAAGTATAGSDYTTTTGSLTFAVGETSKTITVPILADGLAETAVETFTVTLSSPTNATILDGTGVASVIDDDTAPTVSVAGGSADEDAGAIDFAVTLSAASGLPVTVNYAATAGTAGAGDFTAVSGTLTFAPGTVSQGISVPIVDDLLVEGSETITLTLSSPTNATLGTAVATGTIVDNDSALSVLWGGLVMAAENLIRRIRGLM
jgi:hypothetical protein